MRTPTYDDLIRFMDAENRALRIYYLSNDNRFRVDQSTWDSWTDEDRVMAKLKFKVEDNPGYGVIVS